MDKIAKLFNSLLGLGYLKPMPGTYASAMVFAVGYILYPYFNFTSGILLLAILFVLSLLSVTRLIKNQPNKDPGWIIMDEVLGVILILLFIPDSLIYYILAFIIFRIFDAAKLWPINMLDKIKTPLGVIIDDLAAGVITVLIVRIIYFFI